MFCAQHSFICCSHLQLDRMLEAFDLDVDLVCMSHVQLTSDADKIISETE
jgi:hypothetical protein